MKRPWGVRPDPATGVLSREALIQGFIDAATMLDIAGGCLEVIVGRGPTDMPGEMVMTGAAFIWKDRTDATTSAEQPSTVTPGVTSNVTPEMVESARERAAEHAAEHHRQADEQPDDATRELHGVEPTEGNPDGFDYSKLAEEDVEDEPVAAARR